MRTTRLRASAVLLAVLGVFAWFLWPALQRTWPHAALPLDDAYIHLDYARSFQLRAPFAWLPEQGYSSGETAPLYALLLSVPAHLGLEGDALAHTCTAVGVIATLVGAWQWLQILGRAWPAVGLFLSVGFGLWSLASGMELSVYFAIFSWTVRVADHRDVLRVSLGLAALTALRPEALLLSGLIAAGLAGETRAPLRSFARLFAPAALVQASVFAANLALTGEAQSAGAILKLVTENPGLDAAARLREVLTNLITSYYGAFSRSTQVPTLHLALCLLLVGVALRERRRRGQIVALTLATPLLCVLVSLNSTARFQGFRYYVPAWLCGSAVIALGARRLAQRAPRLTYALVLTLIGAAVPKLAVFREHFRAAAGNIAEQQVVVGLRLATDTPADARVLVGDAGAIPYFSGRSAIDALGLGGFRGMPFVRAATFGEAATLELIERLPPHERPTHLALYASWFPQITRNFGHDWFQIAIPDNVICGAPIKSVYVADWSALGETIPAALVSAWEPARLLDTLDFADRVAERAHQLRAEGPYVMDIREEDGARRFDGCRQLAPDQTIRFELSTPDHVVISAHDSVIGVRGVDLEGFMIHVSPRTTRTGSWPTRVAVAEPFATSWQLQPSAPDAWQLATFGLRPGLATVLEVEVLASARGGLLCHLWWRALD